MIPTFPNFKKLELSDKKEIEEFTSKFPPYSDFNFTSLWSWDTNSERMISILNANLVILFTDYENEEKLLSFLGNNKPEDTAIELINYAKSINILPVLRFISEEAIKNLKNSNLLIEEDRDNFDYVYDVSELSNLSGVKFKEKRHSFNKFSREHPNAFWELKELGNQELYNQIIYVINAWEDKKKIDKKTSDFEYEKIAINKLIKTLEGDKIILSCVSVQDKVIGFSIDEILSDNYAISHFIKADNSYIGIYEFLNKKISEYLKDNGVLFWNWEQDLGIESLRRSKTSYRPINFIKKYKISLDLLN